MANGANPSTDEIARLNQTTVWRNSADRLRRLRALPHEPLSMTFLVEATSLLAHVTMRPSMLADWVRPLVCNRGELRRPFSITQPIAPALFYHAPSHPNTTDVSIDGGRIRSLLAAITHDHVGRRSMSTQAFEVRLVACKLRGMRGSNEDSSLRTSNHMCE